MVASFELAGSAILLKAEQQFQLQQMMDILREKLVKRRVDVRETDWGLPLQFTNFRD